MLAMLARCALAAFFFAFLISCSGTGPVPGQATAGSAPPASRQLSSTTDLNGKRIGVVMGSVYDGFATTNYPQATILQFDTQADLRLAVLTGKVDAGMT